MHKHRDALPNILASSLYRGNEKQYFHWNELRRRKPPSDLSLEQWWFGIKIGRISQYRSLPFTDQQGRPFQYVHTDRIIEILHEIDMWGGARIGDTQGAPTEEQRDTFIFDSLIEEAISSSQLEGAATTSQEAKEMIRSGQQPRGRHERMIMNNYLAMKQVRELAQQEIGLQDLLDLHRQLTEDTLDNLDATGRFQTPQDKRVCIAEGNPRRVLYQPPPAEVLPGRVKEMLKFAHQPLGHSFIHPVIQAILLHFWLVYDHPFEDGNGRTARVLFYWKMLRSDYPLFGFISISAQLKKAPAQYRDSFLRTETDDNDLSYFLLHQLEVMQKAIRRLKKYMQRKEEQIKTVRALLKNPVLNHRQETLLSHSIRHPHHDYAITSHAQSHRVSYSTAREDLLDLTKRGLMLKAARDKKTSVFRPILGLEKRLQEL